MAKRSAQKMAARERAAAIKAEQEAAERRKRLIIVAVTLGVIALMILGLVIAALNRPEAKATASAPLSAADQKTLTSVPAKTLDDIGLGTANHFPNKLKKPTSITSNGKPQILYVGAEYCPYCAGLRWSTAVAMSRFGTWGDLSTTHSAPAPEVFPDTATLSFAQKSGTKLTSDVIDFQSYETATNTIRNGTYGKLDTLPGDIEKTFRTYDAEPYVDKGSAGAIPFISFGGKAIHVGGVFDTSVLAGKTHAQIVAELKNPSSDVAKAVLGGANLVTAATCEATGGKPTAVCTAPGVKAAAAKLGEAG